MPLREINIRDAPMLKCQITEPAVNENVVIANIPIKVTAKAIVSE